MDSKPVPNLGWSLEVQAGRCYTRALLSIFEKEIKDSKLLYWVEKVRSKCIVAIFSVGRPEKKRSTWRTVSYNSDGVDEVVVFCFEFVGLLCRHVLCVFWKKLVKEIPAHYILERWMLEARYRFVAVDICDDVGFYEVDIRYKCNKVVELVYRSPTFAEKLDGFLTRKFAEYDVSSQAPNSQVEPTALNFSQNSSNLAPLINIRDPTAPARHKGRQILASRILSGLEESQGEPAKKRRMCGYCGENGHYKTGCSKFKEDNVALDGSQAQ